MRTVLYYIAQTIFILALANIAMFSLIYGLYYAVQGEWVYAILLAILNYIVMGRFLYEHYIQLFKTWFR